MENMKEKIQVKSCHEPKRREIRTIYTKFWIKVLIRVSCSNSLAIEKSFQTTSIINMKPYWHHVPCIPMFITYLKFILHNYKFPFYNLYHNIECLHHCLSTLKGQLKEVTCRKFNTNYAQNSKLSTSQTTKDILDSQLMPRNIQHCCANKEC